jgi:hypothetical protein
LKQDHVFGYQTITCIGRPLPTTNNYLVHNPCMQEVKWCMVVKRSALKAKLDGRLNLDKELAKI